MGRREVRDRPHRRLARLPAARRRADPAQQRPHVRAEPRRRGQAHAGRGPRPPAPLAAAAGAARPRRQRARPRPRGCGRARRPLPAVQRRPHRHGRRRRHRASAAAPRRSTWPPPSSSASPSRAAATTTSPSSSASSSTRATSPTRTCRRADGQPQLVGAAAGQARPRTGHDAGHDRHRERARRAVDPEELRYAPRPPGPAGAGSGAARGRPWCSSVLARRRGGLRATTGRRTSTSSPRTEGNVTIYRGVEADIPGITLQHVEEVTDIDDRLPAGRSSASRSMPASRRPAAPTPMRIVAELEHPHRADARRPPRRPSPYPDHDHADEAP